MAAHSLSRLDCGTERMCGPHAFLKTMQGRMRTEDELCTSPHARSPRSCPYARCQCSSASMESLFACAPKSTEPSPPEPLCGPSLSWPLAPSPATEVHTVAACDCDSNISRDAPNVVASAIVQGRDRLRSDAAPETMAGSIPTCEPWGSPKIEARKLRWVCDVKLVWNVLVWWTDYAIPEDVIPVVAILLRITPCY